MTQEQHPGLTPIALRHAKIIDADKVRYRVYRTKTDYVAVIAENALMAMKVADIKEPYRIVRDLPTHEISITADRFVQEEASAVTRIAVSTAAKFTQMTPPTVELQKNEETLQTLFKTLHLRDLQFSKLASKTPVPSAAPKEMPVIEAPAAAEPTPEVTPPREVALLPVEAPKPAEEQKNETLSPADVDKLLNG